MPDINILDTKAIERLSEFFVEYVSSACDTLGLPDDSISISAIELAGAFKEAAKDLEILDRRRKPKNGISWGKLAGVLWFRLSRYRIVNIQDMDGVEEKRLHEKRKFYRIQDIAIFQLVFEKILHIQAPEPLMKELLYIMARRHMNQEMLGVTLDALLHETRPTS